MIVETVEHYAARRYPQEEPPLAPSAASSQIVRIGAAMWDALEARLGNPRQHGLYDHHKVFTPADRARAAIVCQNAEDFCAKCDKLSRTANINNRAIREHLASLGIFFGIPAATAGRPAFVFPGGSQYQGMLAELTAGLPERSSPEDCGYRPRNAGLESFAQLAGAAEDLATDVKVRPRC